MTDQATRELLADRRVEAFKRSQDGDLRLAQHAALPVALSPDLLHLIRINFLLDEPDPPPYTAEADLLLSPLCEEIGEGLYEIDHAARDILLRGLVRAYGPARLQEIASLLWHYSHSTLTWAERPGLERAQQLTALNILDPTQAAAWLADAEAQSGTTGAVEQEWFVVMGREREASLDLMRAEPGVSEAALIEEETGEALPGAPTVLVADDEQAVREILRDLLEEAGYQVVEAENGQAALEQVELRRPQLIFLDYRMPVMDGFETLQQLRMNPTTSSIPVLVISAWSDGNQALALGANGFVLKPFDLEELLEQVRRLIVTPYEVIVYDQEEILAVRERLELLFEEVKQRYLRRDISLELTDDAKEYLLHKSYNPLGGDQPLPELLLKHIEEPLNEQLASGSIPQGSRVLVAATAIDEVGPALKFLHEPLSESTHQRRAGELLDEVPLGEGESLDDEQRERMLRLLQDLLHRLRILENQAATYTTMTPSYLITEIENTRQAIIRIRAQIGEEEPKDDASTPSSFDTPADLIHAEGETSRLTLRRLWRHALTAYFTEDWEEAEGLLELVARLNPTYEDVQERLIIVRQKKGEQAITEIDEPPKRYLVSLVTPFLERALRAMAVAGDNSDLLGVSLLGFHSALEVYVRAWLAANPRVPEVQRRALMDPKQAQWKELLDAMQLYGNLRTQDLDLIRRANRLRNSIAHGGRYTGTRVDLERYAALVQSLCGYTPSVGSSRISRSPSRKQSLADLPKIQLPLPKEGDIFIGTIRAFSEGMARIEIPGFTYPEVEGVMQVRLVDRFRYRNGSEVSVIVTDVRRLEGNNIQLKVKPTRKSTA